MQMDTDKEIHLEAEKGNIQQNEKADQPNRIVEKESTTCRILRIFLPETTTKEPRNLQCCLIYLFKSPSS